MKRKQVKIAIEPEIATAFKKTCINNGISMAKELSRFMSARANILNREQEKTHQKLERRGERRKEFAKLIAQIEAIKDAEEDYMSRIPENLQSGPAYESAGQTVEVIGSAIDLLYEAFS